MKKIVMAAVVLVSVVFFSSCTDSDLKDLEQRNETQLQLTDPADNGTIEPTDPDDDGEG